VNERSCRRLSFFQVNPFHVDSGDTLFGGPKLFDGSLAYVNDSCVGVEVVLAWKGATAVKPWGSTLTMIDRPFLSLPSARESGVVNIDESLSALWG
jgi:hypothetical protein